MRLFSGALLSIFFVAFAVWGEDDIIQIIADEIRAGKHQGVKGGILSVGDKVLFEAYAPNEKAEYVRDIRSATKSITSILIGELIEQRMLDSVKIPVADILQDEFSEIGSKDLKRLITIEDLLTMRSGLACNDWLPSSVGHEDKMYETDNWAAFILSQPMAHETGKHFSYCTGGVVLLGRIIEKLSGMSVPDFANAYLFSPLGITEAQWAKTPMGHTDTGGHLKLTLKNLHTLGLAVADDGQGIMQKEWLQKALANHTDIYERRETFGYLWWQHSGEIKGRHINLIYAHGNGGNFIFLVPELDLVAAFTGVNFGKSAQFIPKRLLTQKIIPALIDE